MKTQVILWTLLAAGLISFALRSGILLAQHEGSSDAVPGEPARPADRAALRKQVSQAFEVRQESLRNELAEFRGRLDKLARTLEERERSKNAIIDHRVEELLNPNLRWNAENTREDVKPKSAQDPAARIIEDVQREDLLEKLFRRQQQIGSFFRSGNASVEQVLQAEAEFANAKLEAARNPLERFEALDNYRLNLSNLKRETESLVKGGHATKSDLLAAEAAYLEVRQRLARNYPDYRPGDDIPPGVVGPLLSKATPRQQGDDTSSPRHGSEAMHSASEFQRMFADALNGAGPPSLEIICAEYAAHIELLKIDLEAAQAALVAAKTRFDIASQLYKGGETSQARVLDANSELEAAKVRIKRGETLLALYSSKPLAELHAKAKKAVEESQKSSLDRLLEHTPGLKPVDADGGPSAKAAALIYEVLGVRVKPVTGEEVKPGERPMPRHRGLVIIELRSESLAEKSGLRVDDLLLGLHGWETVSFEGLAFILNHAELRPEPGTDKQVRALVLRGNDPVFVSITFAGGKPAPRPEAKP